VLRVLRYSLYGAAMLVLIVTGIASWLRFSSLPTFEVRASELSIERTPARVAEGRRLAQQMCVGCHQDRATGTLSGHRIADVPRFFGEFHSANITRHPEAGIGSWTDGELAYLLRTGIRRDGRLAIIMPAFPTLADEELRAIVAFLRSDDPLLRPTAVRSVPPAPTLVGKAIARFVMGPEEPPSAPITVPPAIDTVALGRYLALGRLHCFGCHSADIIDTDIVHPEQTPGFFGGGAELADASGQPIYSPNLTPDEETGIGRWSRGDFVRALRTGVRPDNTPLRYPMEPMPALSEHEASAIYDYLRTVPAIAKPRRVPAVAPVPAVSHEQGAATFQKYCVGCHGADGKGIYDLTQATERLRSDAMLEAWIRNPASIRPDSRMPAWNGILRDEDYAPLIAHVRALQARPH